MSSRLSIFEIINDFVFVSDPDKRPSKLVQDYVGGKGKSVEAEEEDVSEEDSAGPREPEILKYNSSIHMENSLSGPPKKVFTYYWKIRHIQYKLTGEDLINI